VAVGALQVGLRRGVIVGFGSQETGITTGGHTTEVGPDFNQARQPGKTDQLMGELGKSFYSRGVQSVTLFQAASLVLRSKTAPIPSLRGCKSDGSRSSMKPTWTIRMFFGSFRLGWYKERFRILLRCLFNVFKFQECRHKRAPGSTQRSATGGSRRWCSICL
jgi:hypothetical protein